MLFVVLGSTTSKVEVLINISTIAILAILDLHVSNVSVALELIAHIITIIISKSTAIVTDIWLLELESILQTYLA